MKKYWTWIIYIVTIAVMIGFFLAAYLTRADNPAAPWIVGGLEIALIGIYIVSVLKKKKV